MNLFGIMERFSTQENCIAYLEEVRWDEEPQCPHPNCGSENVARKKVNGKSGRTKKSKKRIEIAIAYSRYDCYNKMNEDRYNYRT